MPRNRMIKPEFWGDEKLSQVSMQARLFYIATWNFSDDFGVIKGHPLWLKNNIFPYDEIKMKDFNAWLKELMLIKRLIPFQINGEKFLYISKFNSHQKINRPSEFIRNPEPPENICNYDPHDILTEGSMSPQAPKEVKIKENNTYERNFLEFWKAYPNRKDKKLSYKAWKKIKVDSELLKKILEAIKNQKLEKEILNEKNKFCPEWPLASTWLNKERWDDETININKSKQKRVIKDGDTSIY